jgi:phosphatidylserine decarboxylase
MIRYGSQVELVVPITKQFRLETIQETGVHVEAGLDPLIKIHETDPEGYEAEVDPLIKIHKSGAKGVDHQQSS